VIEGMHEMKEESSLTRGHFIDKELGEGERRPSGSLRRGLLLYLIGLLETRWRNKGKSEALNGPGFI